MSIPTYRRFIGDEVFTDFIKHFNDEEISSSLENYTKGNVTKGITYLVNQTTLRVKGDLYVFFNSTINYYSNEPLSESEEIIIDDEDFYEKNIEARNTINPPMSRRSCLNLLLQKNCITTILLGEKNGQLCLVEKDYKYRVVVFHKYHQKMPPFEIRKIDKERYYLFGVNVFYSNLNKEFYPKIKENIEICEGKKYFNHEMLGIIVKHGLILSSFAIFIYLEPSKQLMPMFDNQYDLNFKEYLSLKENKENTFCFLSVSEENKLIVERNTNTFEKNYITYNISINILKCLNNKTTYREFLVEINEYVRSKESLKTVRVNFQRSQTRKKQIDVTIDLSEILLDKKEPRKKISPKKENSPKNLISEEEALKNAQKLIEEEEKQQQKKNNKKNKEKKS